MHHLIFSLSSVSTRLTPARSTAWLALLATLMMPLPANAVPAQDKPLASYRLGIFPYLAPRQTVKFYGPVAASMAAEINHPIKLESVAGFSGFTDALSRQIYDIALIQPFDYGEAVDQYGYLPLAKISVPLVSKFYVRSDSRYQTLADLRGTALALPPAESAVARMSLRALHDNHVLPGGDVDLHYFNSHDSCLQQVWLGKASACGSAPPPVKVFETRMHASLRVIYSTPPIPHALFIVHPRVPAAQRAKLQALILGWSQSEQGRVILSNLGFPGFVVPKPDEYTVMRSYDPIQTTHVASTQPKIVKNLILGVFPFLSPRELTKKVAPILPALSRLTGIPVHFQTATNYGAFQDGVALERYDIILVQPFDYAKALRAGYLPLTSMKNPLQGTFYVRIQSPYQTIQDFKGQRIAMPPAESAQSRLGRRALLQAGLVLGRDVTIDYRPTHDSCLRDVQQGKAAACLTTTVAHSVIPVELTRNLRTVGLTDKIPGLIFMADKRLPAQLHEKLQTEIVSWKDNTAGREILKTLGLGDFEVFNPDEYQKLNRFEEAH